MEAEQKVKFGMNEVVLACALYGAAHSLYYSFMTFGVILQFEKIFEKLEVPLPAITTFIVTLGDIGCISILLLSGLLPIIVLLLTKKLNRPMSYYVITSVGFSSIWIMICTKGLQQPLFEIIRRLNG